MSDDMKPTWYSVIHHLEPTHLRLNNIELRTRWCVCSVMISTHYSIYWRCVLPRHRIAVVLRTDPKYGPRPTVASTPWCHHMAEKKMPLHNGSNVILYDYMDFLWRAHKKSETITEKGPHLWRLFEGIHTEIYVASWPLFSFSFCNFLERRSPRYITFWTQPMCSDTNPDLYSFTL